jgi:hypothetical protein
MDLTNREILALVHGLLIGGPFLLAFAGALVAVAGLRADYLTAQGIHDHVKHLRIGVCVMAGMAWVIVLIGLWILLPWYAEDTPDSPRSRLLADPGTKQWHEFADVWKTHVAFMAPILATAAAALVVYYGPGLARDRISRNLVLGLVLAAFSVASIAALVGALVTRAAPLR